MRILQRRVWLPALITSYWDYNTLQAQLCFSYSPSLQPTFNFHSQDCLLSFCVFIKGLDSSWVLLSNHESREKVKLSSDCLTNPPSHFAGALLVNGCVHSRTWEAFKEYIKLGVVTDQDITWFLALELFYFSCITHLARHYSLYLVICTGRELSRRVWNPVIYWKDQDFDLAFSPVSCIYLEYQVEIGQRVNSHGLEEQLTGFEFQKTTCHYDSRAYTLLIAMNLAISWFCSLFCHHFWKVLTLVTAVFRMEHMNENMNEKRSQT